MRGERDESCCIWVPEAFESYWIRVIELVACIRSPVLSVASIAHPHPLLITNLTRSTTNACPNEAYLIWGGAEFVQSHLRISAMRRRVAAFCAAGRGAGRPHISRIGTPTFFLPFPRARRRATLLIRARLAHAVAGNRCSKLHRRRFHSTAGTLPSSGDAAYGFL